MILKNISLIPQAYAQITNPALNPKVGTGEGAAIFGNIVSTIVGFLLIVGAIFALLHLIFGAIRWITASGDKNQLQNAQERITQAIIGLIILVSIWALMTLLSTILGLGFPEFALPSFTDSPRIITPGRVFPHDSSP